MNRAIDLLAMSSDPLANGIARYLRQPQCDEDWKDGLWHADGSDGWVDSQHPGSHFYNAQPNAGCNTYYDPKNVFGGICLSGSFNAATNAANATYQFGTGQSAVRADQYGAHGGGRPCFSLGLGMHFMTDVTMPFHASNFSGGNLPRMLHPAFESYVPRIQGRYVQRGWAPPTRATPAEELAKASRAAGGFHGSLMHELLSSPGHITIDVGEAINYSGPNFIDIPGVDAVTGAVLRAAQSNTADYLHAVFRTYTVPWVPAEIDRRALAAGLGARGPRRQDAWFTQFERGDVYWSAETGALAVLGAIDVAYRASGASRGPRGFPVTEERACPDVPNDRVQLFQHGALHWSATTGQVELLESLAYGNCAPAGLAANGLGPPLETPVQDAQGRWVAHYQYGDVYWSRANDLVAILGNLWEAFRSLGGPAGPLGFPIARERVCSDLPTDKLQVFEHGALHWNYDSGRVATLDSAPNGNCGPGDAINVRARAAGIDVGNQLGRYVEDSQGRWVAHFNRGDIFWSRGAGAIAVLGAMAEAVRSGGGTARLGFPIHEEQKCAEEPTDRLQLFEHAALHWVARTNHVTVRVLRSGTRPAPGVCRTPEKAPQAQGPTDPKLLSPR